MMHACVRACVQHAIFDLFIFIMYHCVQDDDNYQEAASAHEVAHQAGQVEASYTDVPGTNKQQHRGNDNSADNVSFTL
jgi:hypothetical protein